MLKPNDLPDSSKIEITVEDGSFVACFFPEQHQRYYLGSGTGKTVEEAIREALDEAGK